MRVHVVGGFLGAGKTTAVRALARELTRRGERVAIVTNDQGHDLVDTALLARDTALVREVGGGCFCCRYPELEAALAAAYDAGATVAIAEAVGSCTDLIATVISPLCQRSGDRYALAPLAVVVDPWRVEEIARSAFADDVRYLFEKQLEEADVILVSRADASPPNVVDTIRKFRGDAALVSISGTTGDGIAEWLASTPRSPAPPLQIDYERYAAGEAALGWLNARVRVACPGPLSPRHFVAAALDALRPLPIAHVKLAIVRPQRGAAAVVRRGGDPWLDLDELPPLATDIEVLLNARAETSPDALRAAVERGLRCAAPGASVTFVDISAFAPSRPVPVHRSTYRCGSGDDASCCAAFYARRDVGALLGASWHPGGTALTVRQADGLRLPPRAKLLDVACGAGESLRALVARLDVDGVGLDARAPALSPTARLRFVQGDAQRLPFEDGTFDAALAECALSTFDNPLAALLELRRVTRPGARFAVSDMVVEGELPEMLGPYAHRGACLAHARPLRGWRELFARAGLAIELETDETRGLVALLSDIKRRLVGVALGRAAGVLPKEIDIDVPRGRALVREAERAVRDGRARYSAWILVGRA